jgi:hypothetical protein
MAVEPDRRAAFGNPRRLSRPLGDQVPAGFELPSDIDRLSVPSTLVTNRIAPGPSISLPIMVTSDPSEESAPFPTSKPWRGPIKTVLLPPSSGTVRTVS